MARSLLLSLQRFPRENPRIDALRRLFVNSLPTRIRSQGRSEEVESERKRTSEKLEIGRCNFGYSENRWGHESKKLNVDICAGVIHSPD